MGFSLRLDKASQNMYGIKPKMAKIILKKKEKEEERNLTLSDINNY